MGTAKEALTQRGAAHLNQIVKPRAEILPIAKVQGKHLVALQIVRILEKVKVGEPVMG